MAFDLDTAKPVGEEAPKKSGFNLSTAKPVTETGGGAALVTPKQRSTPSSPETKEVTSGERMKRIAETGAMGVPLGVAAPYLTMAAGAGLAGFPATAPLGIGLMEAGGMMRAAGPVAGAVTGLLSGLGEEAAGQYAQAKKYPKWAEETLRVAGGGVTPELKNIIGYGLSKAVSSLGGPTKTEITQAKNALFTDLGINEKELSPTQRQYIEQVFNEIRGGAKSTKPAEALYSSLEMGTKQLVDQHAAQASALELQAQELIKTAQQSAQMRSSAAQSRVDKIASEFENNAKKFEDVARQRADNIEKTAKEKAAQIRSYASKESPSIRALHEMDAQQMLDRGRQEANKVLQESRQKIADLRARAGRTASTTEKRTTEAAKGLAEIGAAQTPTKVGTDIRESVTPIFEKLKKVRAENAEKNKGEAFTFAKMKEQKGEMPKDTNSFKEVMASLQQLITNTSLPDIKVPLIKIRDALDPVKVLDGVTVGTPVKFESLEQIRRFLKDRAYGLPAEGYDAIGQQQAGALADDVERIMKEFSPGIEKFLEQYKADSEPLRIFKTKLGEALVGKEEFDMARFSTDPALLAGKFFRSETGVKDLITLLGENAGQAEGIARAYVADKLRGASGKQVKDFVDKTARDWIDTFPSLKQQLNTTAENMIRAEKFGGAREKVGSKLRQEAGKVEAAIPVTTGRILSQAEKDAAAIRDFGMTQQQAFEKGQLDLARQIEEAGRTEAQAVSGEAAKAISPQAQAVSKQQADILKQAKTAGEQEVSEAQKAAGALTTQAAGLTAEAQKIQQEIIGKKFTKERVQQIILSGDRNLWTQISPLINQDPAARGAVKDAVRQVLADIGPGAPRSTLAVFDNRILPAMEATGLMKPTELASLKAELDRVRRVTDPTTQQSMMQRILRMTVNSVTGEAARGAAVITDPFNAYRK